MWRDKGFVGDLSSLSIIKKRYFRVLFSFIIYIIGILLWIFLYHSDGLVRVTYLTIIPVLLMTVYYFHLIFVNQGTNIEEEHIKEVYQTLTNVETYKKIFFIPLILSLGSMISFVLLPWFSTSASILDIVAYNNCTAVDCQAENFTHIYTSFYDLFTIGLSRYFVYGITVLALLSGILVALSYNDLIKKQSTLKLRIGMYVSTASSFVGISSIFILYYYLIDTSASGYPHILYYSLEIGIVLGIIFVLFSTAVTYNLLKIMYKLTKVA